MGVAELKGIIFPQTMLHVCGSNEIVLPIVALCLEEGWNALCNITGEFLESTKDVEPKLPIKLF